MKLRYLHRNPVKRGLVSNPEDWKWSSHRHYAFRETGNRRRAEECLGFSFASSVKGFQGALFSYEEPLELVCTSPATRPDFMIKAS